MARWVVDDARPGLLLVHLEDPLDAAAPDFETLLTALAHVKARALAEPCVVVLDLTGARPDARKRQRLISWIQDEGMVLRHRIHALAVVAPSARVRGAWTAVRWFFSDRGFRSEVFDGRDAAMAWATRQVR